MSLGLQHLLISAVYDPLPWLIASHQCEAPELGAREELPTTCSRELVQAPESAPKSGCPEAIILERPHEGGERLEPSSFNLPTLGAWHRGE